MASPRLPAFRSDHLWREASEPTFWLDKALRVVWVNRSWEALTGFPAERILGMTCKSHLAEQAGDPADLAASFHPPLSALEGHPASGPALIIHAQGERLWRQLDFWPFHDSRNELIGFLGRVREPELSPQEAVSNHQNLHDELLSLRKRLHQRHGFDTLIGQGDAHDRLLDQIRLAASTTSPVLIIGEPGTGKRSVARTIHSLGSDPLLPINFLDIEALPSDLLEPRLFDSWKQQSGACREGEPAANDEFPSTKAKRVSTVAVGDILLLPRDLQARLATSLSTATGPRLLAMTSGDPDASLRSEQLRSDLYYAMTPLVLRLPPLRDRREELMLFAQRLLERDNRQGGTQKHGFSASAQAALLEYDWPGNLRELDRVINHARQQNDGTFIQAEDLPASIRGNLGAAYLPGAVPPAFKPIDELLTDIERRLIENALTKARRNKTRAAELLGISRPRLYRRMKELNLEEEADTDEETGPSMQSVKPT